VRTEGANARQISAVPNCPLVRRTSAQVRPAPATPVTVIPADRPSVAMKASSNSLLEPVLNAGVAIVAAEFDRSVDRTTSTARLPQAAVVAMTSKSKFDKQRGKCESRELFDAALAYNIGSHQSRFSYSIRVVKQALAAPEQEQEGMLIFTNPTMLPKFFTGYFLPGGISLVTALITTTMAPAGSRS